MKGLAYYVYSRLSESTSATTTSDFWIFLHMGPLDDWQQQSY